MTETDPLDRDRLVEAMLPHVAFEGWSWSALRAAARDLGMPEGSGELAFPGGMGEVLAAYLDKADRDMLTALEDHDLAAMKVRDKVTLAVRVRLELAAPHKEAVRRALTTLATPRHAPLALTALHRTVDAIWYACGDRSTDHNYYTKRGLLAGVYMATLFFWLDDRSEGHTATLDFLDRRIAEVMRLPRLGAEMGARLGAVFGASPLAGLARGFRGWRGSAGRWGASP